MGVTVRMIKGKPHLGYWVFVSHRSQRKSVRIGDKREAEAVAKLIRKKIVVGEYNVGQARHDETREATFGEYFRQWLTDHARVHCKESTAAGYETAFRLYLKPALGERRMGEITRADIRGVATAMLKAGKSYDYTKATLAPLSTVLNQALEDGLVRSNPAFRVLKRSRFEREKKVADFLSRQELAHLLATCQRQYPKHYPFVLLLARTGLRIGEAVALQWKDVDFHGPFLEVRRNYVDGRITSTKPGTQRRVDLSRQLAAVLKDHLAGRAESATWIFTTGKGTHLDPDNFRARDWPKILSVAGMRRILPHALRHTFASLLIQQGAPMAYVKEQLGHHSIRITVDTYGHLVPGGHREEMDKLDDYLVPLEVSQ